jgi:hypothetical protein
MKYLATLGLFLSVALCVRAGDITTLDGHTFKDATILRHDAATATIRYASGIERVSLTNLPIELQQEFGFDPAKAAELLKRERVADAARTAAQSEHWQYERDLQSKVMIGTQLVDRTSIRVTRMRFFIAAKNAQTMNLAGGPAHGTSVDLAEQDVVLSPTMPRDRMSHIGGFVGGGAGYAVSPAAPPTYHRTEKVAFLLDYYPTEPVGSLIEVDAAEDNRLPSGAVTFVVPKSSFTFEQWRAARPPAQK